MSFYTVTLALGGALGAILGSAAQAYFQLDGLIGLGVIFSVISYVSLGPVLRYERAMVKAAQG